MKQNKWFIIFAILVFGLFTPLMAKEGAVKVDTDTNCENGTETNQLCAGDTAHILIGTGGNPLVEGDFFTCHLCERKGDCDSFPCTFSQVCEDPNYFAFAFEVPPPGKYKVTVDVFDEVTKNVGSDSFTVIDCNGF